MFILSLLVIVQYTAAQTYTCDEVDKSYERGDNILVCVYYQSTANQLKRIAYQLVVDDYTALLSPGAYTALSTATIQITTRSGLYSTVYGTNYITPQGVYPIMSIVIQFNQGHVIDVFWDNVCFGVGTCGSQTYTTSGNEVTESNDYFTSCPTPQECDPKIYVSFMGTSSSGAYMTSSGMRMSKFRDYSTAEIYQNAQSSFSKTASEQLST